MPSSSDLVRKAKYGNQATCSVLVSCARCLWAVSAPSSHPTADCVRFPMSAPIVGRRVSQQPARLVWSERHPLGMPSSSDLAREVNIATRRLAACCVWCQGHSCCTVARVSGLRVREGKGIDSDIRLELFSGMSDKTNRTRQNPEGGRRRGRMTHGRFFLSLPQFAQPRYTCA